MSTAKRCMAASTSSGTVAGPGMLRKARPLATVMENRSLWQEIRAAPTGAALIRSKHLTFLAGQAAFNGFHAGVGDAGARHRVVAADIRADDGQRFHQHAGADAVDAHTAPELAGGALPESPPSPFPQLAQPPKR